MLSRLVIAFLPRSKHLLISWLQSPSAVILEPKKIKSVTVYIVSSSVCHEVMGPDAMILVFWMWSFKPPFSTHTYICASNSLYICLWPLKSHSGDWDADAGERAGRSLGAPETRVISTLTFPASQVGEGNFLCASCKPFPASSWH